MNPLTGTRATDDESVVGRVIKTISVHSDEFGALDGLTVEVNEEDVLYTHVGTHDQIGMGAVLVMVRSANGSQRAVVYGDLLKADRGQIYANDYYVGEIPALRMDRNDMLWALDVLHRDDLTDPKTVAKRNARLERVRRRLATSNSKRKLRAAEHAKRGQGAKDKHKRRNPMASAMVTWGGTVQLNKQLRVALGADERVSKSRAAIMRLLGATWKTFHDADIELASMERWWNGDRARPFTPYRAERLARRAMNVYDALSSVKAAPFSQMPMFAQLREKMNALAAMLVEPRRYMHAIDILKAARLLLSKLLIHRVLTQMMVTAGRARRFNRVITKKEQLAYVRAADQASSMVRDAFNQSGRKDEFLRVLSMQVIEAKQVGLAEQPFDAGLAYTRLEYALDLYLV